MQPFISHQRIIRFSVGLLVTVKQCQPVSVSYYTRLTALCPGLPR